MPCATPAGCICGVETSAWASCPRCKAPRIRCRYQVRPGFPGFNHAPDCRYMLKVARRRRNKGRYWNYQPQPEPSSSGEAAPATVVTPPDGSSPR